MPLADIVAAPRRTALVTGLLGLLALGLLLRLALVIARRRPAGRLAASRSGDGVVIGRVTVAYREARPEQD